MLLDPILKILRQGKREKALALAATWPLQTAKIVRSAVVPKDLLAEEGTAFQSFQVECAFYFIHEGNYCGGHLRSTPVSDSEGHRLLAAIPEDAVVQVRYNPVNPDDNHTLPGDNPGALPFPLWPF